MAKEELIVKISANAKAFNDEVERVKRTTKDLEGQLTKVAKVSGVAFVALTAAIGGTIAAAAKMETVKVQFEVLTGSVGKAAKAMRDLQEFSAKTPFQFGDIAEAGKALLAFGIEVEDLTETMQQIGDVTSITNRSIKDIAIIFGQVSVAGKLTGERFNQLIDAGVNIGPEIAKSMNVGEKAVRGLITAGKVTTEVFQEAFAAMSKEGGIAFEGMIKRSKTLEGLISTVKDNFILLTAEIGKRFLPAAKEVANTIIKLFSFLRSNPILVDMAVNILGVGAALTGLVFSLTVAGVAFIKLRIGVIALNTSLKGATIAVRGLKFSIRSLMAATVFGALLIGVGFLIERFIEAKKVIDLTGKTSKSLGRDIRALEKELAKTKATAATFSQEVGTSGRMLETANPKIAEMEQKLIKLREAQKKLKGIEEADLVGKKKAKVESEALATEKAEQEQLLQLREGARDQLVELKEIEIETLRGIEDAQAEEDKERLTAKLEEIRELEKELRQEQHEEDLELREEKFNELFEQEEEFDEQFKNMTDLQRAQLEQDLKAGIKTETQLRADAAKARISSHNRENAKFLDDQMKFGKAFATINSGLRSREFQGAKQGFSQLTALTASENSKLKAIGKVSSIAMTVIRTAESAMAAFAGFAAIPIVGIPLGLAAAAAVVAFGAENISKISAAQTGGLVAGGIPGIDSVPTMLQPGEIVIPESLAQNFQNLAGVGEDEDLEPGEGQNVNVMIGFDGDEAESILTSQQNEASSLGISEDIT